MTPSFVPTTAAAQAPVSPSSTLRAQVAKDLGRTGRLSAGLRTWLAGPPAATANARRMATPTLGSNVDANDPGMDLAAGQSETAIAAQRRGTTALVMAGWNDISGILADPTTQTGSLTGLGLSHDGGRQFTDLTGLPNNNTDQQWSGDPSIASLGDGSHFIISSLYYPSVKACADGLPAYGTVAVSVATVDSAGTGVKFSAPIPVAIPGDLCTTGTPDQPADLGTLDKDWVAYDSTSRTLAVSYTRFYFPPPFICGSNGCTQDPNGHTGNGQIEVVRAMVPANPATLTAAAFTAPAVIWPEEPNCPTGTPSSEQARCGAVDQGAYAAVAPGGSTYVAWERNIDSNLFGSGDPSVYLHAALLPARASGPSIGGPAHRVVISSGQVHGTPSGGTKSLDTVPIAGYSRGQGQDFPRLAINTHTHSVVFVWNDASLHPLGDIWLRSAPYGLGALGKTVRVNDDSSYALHFMPAVSVRSNGTICTSWYDRRIGGADSTRTDYYADCRADATTNHPDVRITTGSTDWAGTSSLINPNFGDYTDNATDGTSTYFTWTDGRLGIPQPFTDHR
jgi:hypothetical protein